MTNVHRNFQHLRIIRLGRRSIWHLWRCGCVIRSHLAACRSVESAATQQAAARKTHSTPFLATPHSSMVDYGRAMCSLHCGERWAAQARKKQNKRNLLHSDSAPFLCDRSTVHIHTRAWSVRCRTCFIHTTHFARWSLCMRAKWMAFHGSTSDRCWEKKSFSVDIPAFLSLWPAVHLWSYKQQHLQ